MLQNFIGRISAYGTLDGGDGFVGKKTVDIAGAVTSLSRGNAEPVGSKNPGREFDFKARFFQIPDALGQTLFLIRT